MSGPQPIFVHFWEATIRPHDSRNCDQESVEASRLFERSWIISIKYDHFGSILISQYPHLLFIYLYNTNQNKIQDWED